MEELLMDGIDSTGPFVATIIKKAKDTDYLRTTHRLFESMEQARDWLFDGQGLVAGENKFKVTKSEPEFLAYEDDNWKIAISLSFDRKLSDGIIAKRG